MATVGFLLLHALKALASPYDCYVFVVCVGLDQIFWLFVWRTWWQVRER